MKRSYQSLNGSFLQGLPTSATKTYLSSIVLGDDFPVQQSLIVIFGWVVAEREKEVRHK